jgi:hypothetical protein
MAAEAASTPKLNTSCSKSRIPIFKRASPSDEQLAVKKESAKVERLSKELADCQQNLAKEKAMTESLQNSLTSKITALSTSDHELKTHNDNNDAQTQP